MRLSSRFSRSSSLKRSLSDVVKPGRFPASRSAGRTQFRSVFALQPIFPAIDVIAAHCDECDSCLLEDEPHRSLPDLLGVPATLSMSSILSRVEASGETGAVQ